MLKVSILLNLLQGVEKRNHFKVQSILLKSASLHLHFQRPNLLWSYGSLAQDKKGRFNTNNLRVISYPFSKGLLTSKVHLYFL